MWSDASNTADVATFASAAVPRLARPIQISNELLQASDATIDGCVAHADPLVFRGLLYQLTGEEELAGMPVERRPYGYNHVDLLTREADVQLIRAKAARLLKQLRDSSKTEIDIGPLNRLPRSLELSAGKDIPMSEMEMWIEETGLYPVARGLKWKNEPTRERKESFFVVVIGGGMSGVNAAVHLKAAGIPFVVIEKNSGVGGVWFENRYPGIRVDTPSRGYLHLFGLEFPQAYSFCPGDENVRYLNWILDKHDLRSHFVFDTEVSDLAWDEETHTWNIQASGPDGARSWRANAVFSCVGFLSRPQKPEIAGLESFRGVACHTAEWPDDLDLTGKRVAVIGSGASGYQTVPIIAKLAAHTYLFQRNASWCYPTEAYADRLPDQVLWIERNAPFYVEVDAESYWRFNERTRPGRAHDGLFRSARDELLPQRARPFERQRPDRYPPHVALAARSGGAAAPNARRRPEAVFWRRSHCRLASMTGADGADPLPL